MHEYFHEYCEIAINKTGPTKADIYASVKTATPAETETDRWGKCSKNSMSSSHGRHTNDSFDYSSYTTFFYRVLLIGKTLSATLLKNVVVS